jgi:hypothetical protein
MCKSARDVPIESWGALSSHSVGRIPRRFGGSRNFAAKAPLRLGSGSPYEKANLPLSEDIVPHSIKRPASGPLAPEVRPSRVAHGLYLSLVVAVGINLLCVVRVLSGASFASKRVAADRDSKKRRIEVGLQRYAALPHWAQIQLILSVLRRHECARSRQTSLCSKLTRCRSVITRLQCLSRNPFVEFMLVEAPIRANLDRLNIVLSEQLVDRSWMDPKVIGYFCRGHDHERFEIHRMPYSRGSGDPKGETHVRRLFIHRRPKVYPPARAAA